MLKLNNKRHKVTIYYMDKYQLRDEVELNHFVLTRGAMSFFNSSLSTVQYTRYNSQPKSIKTVKCELMEG